MTCVSEEGSMLRVIIFTDQQLFRQLYHQG